MCYCPTCDYPNCENKMGYGIAGHSPRPGSQQPSQWCKEHYELVLKKCEKDPGWIYKFQKGKIKGLPKDKRTVRVYAW